MIKFILGLLVVSMLLIFAGTAQAGWPTLHGRASTFGNDPVQGFHDSGDNGVTASGKPTSVGGIAVNNHKIGWQRSWNRYGGGWWKVCPPKFMHLHCHLMRQTDAGPADWVHRTVDVTTAGARRAWGIFASAFPTDQGNWTITYRGKRQR